MNLAKGVPPNESNVTCTSGAGTFSLEFGIISRLTGDPTFEVVSLILALLTFLQIMARNAVNGIWNRRSPKGLVGNHIDIMTGTWTYSDAGIGHGIDSFYEYLLKSAFFFNDEHYYQIFVEVKDM